MIDIKCENQDCDNICKVKGYVCNKPQEDCPYYKEDEEQTK